MSEKKKCGCFCKLLKCLLWCVVGIVLLAAILVAAIPLWISPVATGVATSVVPKLTGTDFKLERFYVNPWTGAIRINGVRLANPEGFGDSPAFSVESISVDVALFELFADRLHIKDITIVDPFASYYSHNGVNNIDAIMANVEKALGPKKEKELEESEKEAKSKMKVQIDHLKISGTKVKLIETGAIPPLPIMTVELTGIGKDSGGASFDDAWQSIVDAFMKSMNSIGDGIGALAGVLGDGAKGLADTLGESTKNVTGALNESAKSVTGALSDGAKGLSDAVGDGAKSVKDVASGAAGAIGDGAKGAVSGVADVTKGAAGAIGDGAKSVKDVASDAAGAIGDGAKATVDAVGDTAKKATEGVKNLFKGFGK